MASRHWEGATLPPLVALVEAFPDFVAPPPKVLRFPKNRREVKQLSPNHWEMGLSGELLWAAAYGDENDWAAVREKYQHLLDLHLREIGFWTSEQFTGAPHGGFYVVAIFCARMAVLARIKRLVAGLEEDEGVGVAGLTLSKEDASLVTDLNEYTRRLFNYMALTADSTGDVICCGERMPKGPAAPQQSAVFRELRGLEHPNRKKIDRQIDDDFWVSLRALRKLLTAKDPLLKKLAELDLVTDGPREMPFTSQPVKVERWKGGHSARYLDYGGDGTCAWVYVNRGELQWGKRGTVPVPADGRARTFETAKRSR